MTVREPEVATHEHAWHVVAVEYDESVPSVELGCACGEVSFTSG